FKSTYDFAGAINSIVCGSNTGTAQGLSVAYQDLQAAYTANAGPLNIVMLFTDGLPNGVSGDYDSAVNMGGSCTCKTPADSGTCQKVGWMSQTSGFAPSGNTNGLFANIGISAANPGNTLITNSPQTDNCAFRGGSANIRNDIDQMVAIDQYGNSTTGYTPVDLVLAKSSPQQLGYASKNAADNAGTTIRNDAILRPMIYAIGLSGLGAAEDPDPTMIMRLTNVKGSPIYDSSKKEGFFVMATSTADLPDSFDQVAQEILRLSW
ncbi:MAG: hypothetical protein ACRD8O_15535, partial [Bryobacteraceae bacterium]